MDKSALFKSRLPETDVEIPEVGTVRVRSLSRAEVLTIRNKDLAVDDMERKLLALALVDPALTQDEVHEWQMASSAGEIESVTSAIMQLSGLNAEAPKQAMTQFRG